MTTVDLKIINGQVLNVFSQTFEPETLWIAQDRIVFRGDTTAYEALTTYDAAGQFIIPGLIDTHMHVESTTFAPTTLATVLLQHGVTRAFIDPHEIANVAGAAAVQYMLDEAKRTPFNYHVMLPSSVPATAFERTGAKLTASDLRPFYADAVVGGLAEVMDYPAVANHDADMQQKIADALAAHKPVDGHGAGLTATQLADYRAVGISTDHEATDAASALDRVNLGMHVLVREGTVEQDEVAILPAITATNQQRFSFATDDKTSVDIVENGSIDHSVRVAVAHGMPLTQALTLATLYAAQAHQLMDVGALAAGYQADLFLTTDLTTLSPQAVMVGGAWQSFDEPITPNRFAENLMTVTLQASDLALPLETGRAHVIDVKPGHIDTTHAILEVPRDAHGQFVANAEFAKITVAERYHDLGNGVGIIRGLGLRRGAVGTTFSNDSHNMVIAGVTDDLMLRAAEELITMGGGMVVVSDDGTVTSLPLDIGGVMSSASAETIVTQTKALHTCLAAISDVSFDIFQTLSFMALPVIPSLKITDQGLFDFEKWDFIDINAD